MDAVDGFVDAVIASPLGVSWLAVLEAGPSADQGWSTTSPMSDPASVAATVELIGEMSFGTIVDAAVFAGVVESGPWMGDAPAKVAAAYEQAERRAPIAEAVAKRFGDELHAPLGHTSQQWWTDSPPWNESQLPLFRHFDDVYGAGEFPVAGLWTAIEPPPEVLVQMVGAWEYETGPISRWWLPVRPEARLFVRYWFSERTLWLSDIFGEPGSAPDPHINLATGHHWPPLPPRSTINRNFMRRLLGRSSAS